MRRFAAAAGLQLRLTVGCQVTRVEFTVLHTQPVCAGSGDRALASDMCKTRRVHDGT